MQSWGYQVAAVEDGRKAWEHLDQFAPDIVILDWMMPGMDGVELCRRIRARKLDRYQYILLISGKDETTDVVEGFDAGADDYLTKPFEIGELQARLRAGERILLLQHNLIQALDALRHQATHDDLTGIWSRGTTLHLLKCELERGARSGTSTGVLMIDLDHFKNINDTFGHLSGDVVLKIAASRIGLAVRSYDLVGRYGGEEFLAVLSNCTSEQLQAVAERVRLAVAESPISAEGCEIEVTASIGAAITASKIEEHIHLLSSADSALYEAKRNGRNRVVIACDRQRHSFAQKAKSVAASCESR
jgi:diguanylate cyclase (GGDEF)-like protein